MKRDQSAGCVCPHTVAYLCWQTFAAYTQPKLITDEQDDVGFFPSAVFLVLLIYVTSLLLTVKHCTLTADSNSCLHNCDLITLQPCF